MGDFGGWFDECALQAAGGAFERPEGFVGDVFDAAREGEGGRDGEEVGVVVGEFFFFFCWFRGGFGGRCWGWGWGEEGC